MDDSDPDTDGFQHDVTIFNNNSPKPAVDLEIRESDSGDLVSSGTSSTPSDGVTTEFPDADFNMGGELDIIPCATDNAGNIGGDPACTGGSPACTVTVADLPVLDITSHSDGDVITENGVDGCAAGEVRVEATTDAADGSDATAQIGSGTVASTTASGGAIDVCVEAADGRDLDVVVTVDDPTKGMASATVTVDIDTMPPTDSIDDLAATVEDRRDGIVRFDWTAVADAGGFQLDDYQLRCADSPISNETDWDAARVVAMMSDPAPGGSSESESINAFRPGVTEECMIRGVDVAGDLTPLGNNATVTIDFLEQTVTDTGTYFVTVANDSGCTARDSSTATPPDSFRVRIYQTHRCDGQVDLSTGNDFADYQWSTGDTTPTILVSDTAPYSVTVTNENSCTAHDTAQVTPHSPPIAEISATYQCNGQMQLAVDSGYASYQWSTGAITPSITETDSGTYHVTITDDSSCTAADTASVDVPDSLSLTLTSSPASCDTCSDGSVQVVVQGGSPPYSYAWSNGDTTATINNLDTGQYIVTVTDSAGCTQSGTIEVGASQNTLTTLLDITPVRCFGDSSGQVNLTVQGGTPPYAYQWSNGDTTANLSGVPVDTYYVTITDSVGIATQDTAVITQPPPLQVTAGTDTALCRNTAYRLGGAPTSAGGTAPYRYEWAPTDPLNEDTVPNPTVYPIIDSVYSVVVTDSAGCQDSSTVTLHLKPTPWAGFSHSTNGLEVNFTDTSRGNVTDWNWDFGDGFVSTEQHPSHAYDSEGTYPVCLNVTSSNGCRDTVCHSLTVTSTGRHSPSFPSQKVTVYPTSTENEIHINYEVSTPQAVRITLLNAHGAISDHISQQKQPGFHRHTLQLDRVGLAPGLYLVHIHLGKQHYTYKVVKQP
jgi:hypothetical protein